MKPALRNLELVRGDAWRENWAIADSVGPVSLTGYTFLCQIRATSESATVLATVTVTPDADQTANKGVLQVYMSGTTTNGLAVGAVTDKVWDFQITDTAGDVRTLVGGGVSVIADVSKP